MNKTNFFGYMASVVSYLEEEQRHGTAHVYRSVLRRVIEFEGLDVLEFNDLTPLWLRSFQEYLLSRQLHWNTISTYMRMLRATYFRAVDDGLAPYRPRLFKGVYTGTKVTVKRAVDEDVFRKLSTPVADERLESTRLLFLLLFMLRGMPFVTFTIMSSYIAVRRQAHGSPYVWRVKLWRLYVASGILMRIPPICSLLFTIRERMNTGNTRMHCVVLITV